MRAIMLSMKRFLIFFLLPLIFGLLAIYILTRPVPKPAHPNPESYSNTRDIVVI